MSFANRVATMPVDNLSSLFPYDDRVPWLTIGDDLAFHFAGEVDGLGGRVAYRTSFVPGTIDFRDTLNELGEVRPDVVFFAGFETENASFIRWARETGFTIPIVGSFSDTPMMRARTGPALEEAMSYEIYDVNAPSAKNVEFVAAYRKR